MPNAIFVSFRRKTATRKYTMFSPCEWGFYHQHRPLFSRVLISPWGSFALFLIFWSQSRSWKATVCFIDSRGRGSRWVNIIDLGIWDWAKINSAEGMIKLTLSYVLHHQLFGLYSQILLWAKVRHLGFTGCVILELYSSIYYIAEYIYIVRHDT